MTKVLYIDPPGGWRYGFPKILPDGETPTNEWFIKNGYPLYEIESYGKHFHYRCWEENLDEDKNIFKA